MNTRSGFQLFMIRGIPIRVHYTFLLVLPFLAYLFGQSFSAAAVLAGVPASDLSGPPWAWGLAVALALFASVLVHEFAHSLYAVAHGGKVRSITLLMIGGVSELSEVPEHPKQEALMALAGPATSLTLGVAFFALRWVTTGYWSPDVGFALFYLGQLNLLLAAFNMLPAFPMDGGRILRAVLVPSHGRARATHIAATVGKVFAGLFALAGLFGGNFFLVIIAFFVFIGAEGELHAVLTRAVLGELSVAELMTAQLDSVAPTDTVYAVGERMIHDKRLSFPVVDHGHVLGSLALDAVEKVQVDQRRVTPASHVMSPATTIAPGDRVADVLRLFAERHTSSLAVVDQDRLVGTVSRFEVLRALRLQGLLATQHPAPGSAPGAHWARTKA
jgi:Zn-dependent protease/CBS domain-containing protein